MNQSLLILWNALFMSPLKTTKSVSCTCRSHSRRAMWAMRSVPSLHPTPNCLPLKRVTMESFFDACLAASLAVSRRMYSPQATGRVPGGCPGGDGFSSPDNDPPMWNGRLVLDMFAAA